MPVLILVKKSRKTTHRCDDRCYDAISRPCRCICQGKNHGVGLKTALINTAKIAKDYPAYSEPSLFHSMTPKLLDQALQMPNTIQPLVILSIEMNPPKEGG